MSYHLSPLTASARRRTLAARIVAAIAAVLSTATQAQAVALKVDFGVGDVAEFLSFTPNDVQDGFAEFSVAATRDGNGQPMDFAEPPAGVITRDFDGLTVSLEGTGLRFVDGPDEDHPLGDLGEDFVVGGSDVVLRLAGLVAGDYLLTTYHYSSELVVVAVSLDFDIHLNAGGGESLISNQRTGGIGTMAAVPIPFTTDGTQDVVVRMSGSVLINGFTLVPEPASWTLLIVGGAALVGAAHRRRRA